MSAVSAEFCDTIYPKYLTGMKNNSEDIIEQCTAVVAQSVVSSYNVAMERLHRNVAIVKNQIHYFDVDSYFDTNITVVASVCLVVK